jgi:hypothetical protein
MDFHFVEVFEFERKEFKHIRLIDITCRLKLSKNIDFQLFVDELTGFIVQAARPGDLISVRVSCGHDGGPNGFIPFKYVDTFDTADVTDLLLLLLMGNKVSVSEHSLEMFLEICIKMPTLEDIGIENLSINNN